MTPYLKFQVYLAVEGLERPKDLQVRIVLKDINSNKSLTVATTARYSFEKSIVGYSFEAMTNKDKFLNTFNESSDFEISDFYIINPETGDTVRVALENSLFDHPAEGWKQCSVLHLKAAGLVNINAPKLPVGTVQGTLVNWRTQNPIGSGVSVHLCGIANTTTNEYGFYRYTGTSTGHLNIVANFEGTTEAYASIDTSHLATYCHFVIPDDEGLEVEPVFLIERADWEYLKEYARDTFGFEQDTLKAFVFGRVLNLNGTPIPDAEITLDPPSGQVVYLDPMEWSTTSATKVREGYYFSGSYYVFNSDIYSHYDCRAIAVHRITGDTIGTTAGMKLRPSMYGITQGDIFADDDEPPADITDLEIEVNGGIKLSWTAPGDDGTQGNAYLYEVRYSNEPVGTDTFDWWYNKAESVSNPPAPSSPGSKETFVLEPGYTGVFMVKARDECMNWSGYSNAVSGIAESPVRKGSVTRLDIMSISTEDNYQIRYTIPRESRVNLSIYTTDGRKVTTIFTGTQLDGTYTVSWNSAQAAPGLYFCRLETEGFVLTEKLVLLR